MKIVYHEPVRFWGPPAKGKLLPSGEIIELGFGCRFDIYKTQAEFFPEKTQAFTLSELKEIVKEMEKMEQANVI